MAYPRLGTLAVRLLATSMGNVARQQSARLQGCVDGRFASGVTDRRGSSLSGRWQGYSCHHDGIKAYANCGRRDLADHRRRRDSRAGRGEAWPWDRLRSVPQAGTKRMALRHRAGLLRVQLALEWRL